VDKEKELYEETQEISEEEKAPEKDATSKIKRRSQPEPEKKQEDDNLCIHCGKNKGTASHRRLKDWSKNQDRCCKGSCEERSRKD
jgi:hypothetical protein